MAINGHGLDGELKVRGLNEGNGKIKGGEMKKGHHCARLQGFDGGGAADPAGNGRRP
jgi:hypothetical protein